MDPQEVARRLARIREAVRDELAGEEGVAHEVADSVPDPSVATRLDGEPNLSSTDWLQRANELSSPEEISLGSDRPLLGPLLHGIRRLARPIIEPFLHPLRRQEEFNSSVVRHLNELGAGLERRVRRLEEAVEATLDDYHAALRRRHLALFGLLEEELLALQAQMRDAEATRGASVSALRAAFTERAQVVDRRLEEKDAALRGLSREMKRLDQLEQSAAELLQMRSRLSEALERAERPLDRGGDGRPRNGDSPAQDEDAEADVALWTRLRRWMEDEDYRAFQRAFRGDDEEVRRRMVDHARRFESAPGPVADLGCGRGELLDLLEEAGIEGVGVEINGADVEACRARGHEAVQADLFDWLQERSPDSLGGVFAAQVIEHLPPRGWQRLVELAASRLAPGGLLVLETINPLSLYALVRAYVVDPTHVRPVHPELLAFLARRAGFSPVETEFQAPVPPADRPQLRVDEIEGGDQIKALAWQVKEQLDRVDRLCCAPQEYTLQATRPGPGSRRGDP